MGLFDVCHPDISIICIFPDYPIEIGGGTRTGGSAASDNEHPAGASGSEPTDTDGDFYLELGHAGILMIKGGTGPAQANYYEYGRYAVEGGNSTTQGNVRGYPVSTLILDDSGWPTVASLRATARSIARRSGRNTKLHGNVDHLCGKGAYDKGVAFAEEFAADESQHYNLVTNSCMMFSFQVNKAGGWDWFGPVPVWNSRPAGQRDFGLFSNYLIYDPDGDRFHESIWQVSS